MLSEQDMEFISALVQVLPWASPIVAIIGVVLGLFISGERHPFAKSYLLVVGLMGGISTLAYAYAIGHVWVLIAVIPAAVASWVFGEKYIARTSGHGERST